MFSRVTSGEARAVTWVCSSSGCLSTTECLVVVTTVAGAGVENRFWLWRWTETEESDSSLRLLSSHSSHFSHTSDDMIEWWNPTPKTMTYCRNLSSHAFFLFYSPLLCLLSPTISFSFSPICFSHTSDELQLESRDHDGFAHNWWWHQQSFR